MSTFKYTFHAQKHVVLTLLFFTASSLFALLVPKTVLFEESNEAEIESVLLNEHPLSGSSDNVLICSEDGSELHEIFLCGENSEKLVDTNIPNLKQIIWSKLQEGSCTAAQQNCGNNSPTCSWDELGTNTQFNITQAGEYKVYVQYNDNSSKRFYFNVFKNALNPSTVVTNIDCGSDGLITIHNVPSNYEFSINSGTTWQDSNQFAITSVDTYDVQLRRRNDPNSCLFKLDDIEVNNNAIDANVTTIPISCNNSKGGIQVEIVDASSTYVYEIRQAGVLINSSGPVTDNTYLFNDLTAGTYDINVTLASISNCSWVATEVLEPFENIQPEVVVTKNIDCTNGKLTVTQSGGVEPYEYSLNGLPFEPFLTGNQTVIDIALPDTYIVKVKDANGCEVEALSKDVIIEPEIEYVTDSKDISCNGNDDGSISVDVTNTQSYSITYSIDGTNFQTSNVFSNLSVGFYSITIKKQKAGGFCLISPTNPTEIKASPDFAASASVTQQIDCNNGSAIIAVVIDSGGTTPLEYSLDGLNFQNNADFTGVGPGNYIITVKDANGCLTTVNQTVTGGSNPSDLTFLESNVDCTNGATDVQVIVHNGQSPFTYLITAPTTINSLSDTFEGLLPNTYTFEITTDDGCKIIRNFIVNNPIGFSSNATVKSNASCATGSNDGSIELSITNFNGSFDVVVEDSNGAPLGLGITNQTISPILISNLAADDYILKISDASSTCEKIETISIASPSSALTIDSFSPSNINCGSPGSVTIEASGGWGNYSYAVQQPDFTITPSQANKTITGLTQAGSYTIRVTDINGCLVDTETFNLIDQGGPTAIIDTANSNYCYSTSTKGELKIDVSGSNTPFFYTLNNGTPIQVTSGTFTLSDLTPEDYVVKVIGNNGCETIVADTQITGQLFAIAQITKPLGCGADPDAIIEITAEEGYPNPDYQYEVSNDGGATYTTASNPYSASTIGTYVFKVIDSKNCETTTNSVIVTQSPNLTSSTNITDTACGKEGTGSVQIIGGGGTPPFTYAFSDTPFSGSNPAVYSAQSVYNNLDATTYYYAIKDALGCIKEDGLTIIGAEAAITADIDKVDISCDPVAGGNIWGNIKVKNIQNTVGLVNISLVRVYDPVKYAAGDETRTWVYREYKNIDLATNSNYNNAYWSALYGTETGFDIRLYWAQHFVLRIEDDRGCFYESPIETVTAPTLPAIVNSDPLDQTCANGATYEFSINNNDDDNDGQPDLLGPFEVRLWPYQLIDADGDGEEDDTSWSWRKFENASNPNWDGVVGDPTNGIPHERDYKFTHDPLTGEKLLFGVAYSVIVRDVNTGCVRWLGLRPVVQPPVGGITVKAVSQSETCTGAADGEVEFTIANYAPGTVNIKIYNASRPQNTSYHYNYDVTGTGAPIVSTLPNMKVAWWVVEVTDGAGCEAGQRFLTYRPKSKLKLELDQIVQPTCNKGGEVAVSAIGGWDDERYFNIRNKLRQDWHEYEYALVLDSQTPTDTDFGSSNIWTNVVPSAYDGINNVYRAFVRDGGGCVQPIANAITFTEDIKPIIGAIDVSNRCTSLDELYDITATISQNGTGTMVYIWDGVVTNSLTKELGPGKHTLQVRDENGCFDEQEIFIYPQLVPQIQISKTADCGPNPDNGELTASAYGGSGTYEFTISPIPTSYAPGEETNIDGVFDRIAPGVNYIVTVTDIDPQVLPLERCAPQDTPSIQLDIPAMPEFEIDKIFQISCHNANDGKITVAQTAAADNLDVVYEYSLDGITYQLSNIFENLDEGPHTVRVRSSKNCVQVLAPVTTIINPTELQLGAPTVSPFQCTAANNYGMATITADVGGTGTAPYLYSFNGNSFGVNTSYDIPYSNSAQNVTIDVKDINNCSDQITVTIPAANKISANFTTTTDMSCVNNGVYEINIDPIYSNYSIVELPVASTAVTITNTPTGGTVTILAGNPNTYSFLITDNDTGCKFELTKQITPFDIIDVVATHDSDIICYGNNNGAINFTTSDFGASGFSYEVFHSNGNIEQTATTSSSTSAIMISNLPAGTFYIKTTDVDTGCSSISEMISIQSPAIELEVTSKITQVLTCTGSDAQVTLSGAGGWGNYEYELTETDSGTIIQTFDINNIINGLKGISYQLRVKDAKNCITTPIEVIIDPIDAIVINENIDVVTEDPSCPGGSDGKITVNYSRINGPSDYDYILTNLSTSVSSLPQSSNQFEGLLAGSYSIKVQDNLNCHDVTDTPIVLTDPAKVEINGVITKQTTCSPNTGEIVVSATGNLGDTFEYQMIAPTTHSDSGIWRLPADNVFSNLASGTYEFIARNQNNCETLISVVRTINTVELFEVVIDDSNTTINCFGESDAILIAQASGGLAGYQYQLEKDGNLLGAGPQASGTFENLGPGTYNIVATSTFSTDCSVRNATDIIIKQPEELIIPPTITGSPVICYGGKTGSVTIPISSGEGPFEFEISSQPGKPYYNNKFEGLGAGTYTIWVADVNYCEKKTRVTIPGPTAPLLTTKIRIVDEVCSSDNNGIIEYEISGGTAPYSYTLESASNSYTLLNNENLLLDNLDGGFYKIFIKDANDCTANLIFEEVKTGADLTSEVEKINECQDGKPYYAAHVVFDDENIDMNQLLFDLDDINPANPNTDDAQLSNEFNDISAGNHTISILHLGTGCVEVKNFEIEEQAPLSLQLVDGAINEILVKANGGSGSYTFTMNDKINSDGSFYITESGDYTISVVDTNGCEASIQTSVEFIDIEIPTFFTPDGDGQNDVWRIGNSEGYSDIYVRIYDRYGRTIKEWISEGEWDGSYNKTDLPTGDYWYVIKLNGLIDDREFVGHITIYR